MKRVAVVCLAVAGLFPVLSTTAAASRPMPVTISVFTVIDEASNPFPFSSTGGVVCDSGTVSTLSTRVAGPRDGTHQQLQIRKQFVCPDGTFDVRLRVTLDLVSHDTSGTWSVASATGAYGGLHGDGKIIGTSVDPGVTIQDEYTGKMHID